MMKIVIVHHASCPDGWGSAWLLRRSLLGANPQSEIELVSAGWGDDPPLDKLLGADVICVDYCYEALQLEAVENVAKTLTVIDHHQTSEGYIQDAGLSYFTNAGDYCDAAELGALNGTAVVLDMNHSGIGLVGSIVKRMLGVDPPRFADSIEDRDLWRFQLSDTKDVTSAVNARPYTIEAWDEINDTQHEQLVAEGRAINLYRDQMIEAVAASTFRLRVGDFVVPCATSPYLVGSDVAGLLAERAEFNGIGAYAILHAEHVQIGLRSRNNGPDVAKLAEGYGGGGHEHASGLRMTWAEFFAARVV